MSLRPVTETPNELTLDIDLASPEGIVRLLRAADAQIFSGYRTYPGLLDCEIVEKLERVIDGAAVLMGRSDAVIVLSGAGTSGRLAMFVARTFNRLLARAGRSANLRYLVAGADRAIIKAQEGAEDDPRQAWDDLRALVQGKRRVLYVGVTCGLSAPYVASQIWHLSRRAGSTCVLLGFNPAEQARSTKIENWDKTFADVVSHVVRKPNCIVVNPVLGPEAITGSTRMKGGSATKLILETIFTLAARRAGLCPGGATCGPLRTAIRECLYAYERTRLVVYEQLADVAELVALGGEALRAGGHIYYVGSGSVGVLGIIDAAECPPTFGAGFEDVRGFIAGGWKTVLGPRRGLDAQGALYRISTDEFVRRKLPELAPTDLVVGLGSRAWSPSLCELLRGSKRARARTAGVQTAAKRPAGVPLDVLVSVPRVPASILGGASIPAEFATKLVINALSTGAHVLSGKVYGNRMVDLRISNAKLCHRAVRIIQDTTGVSAEVARRCLLRSIYQTDRLTRTMLRARPSQHVEAATNMAKVVPRALILAASGTAYAEADRALRKEPIVRVAVGRLLKPSSSRTGRRASQ